MSRGSSNTTWQRNAWIVPAWIVPALECVDILAMIMCPTLCCSRVEEGCPLRIGSSKHLLMDQLQRQRCTHLADYSNLVRSIIYVQLMYSVRVCDDVHI